MSNHIWQLGACELASAIRAGELSSHEAVLGCLARIDAVNPRINAIVDLLADEALVAAKRADQSILSGDIVGPLHGVPVTVKINVDYAGRPTTNGVIAFKNNLAAEDSPSVANLRKAGAIVIGRTNVPAFSTRYFTDNALHGRTLNPRTPSRTPGGSSGGAAAAVAVGFGPIAHGNDRAGSVRYPAYACGVVGIRPSFGVAPAFNPSNRDERGVTSQFTSVQGIMARSVADARIGLKALAQEDVRDPWWMPVTQQCATAGPSRVALFSTFPGAAIDAAVPAALHQAAVWLEDAGYRVEEAVPPRFAEAADLFWKLAMTEEQFSSSRAIEKFGDEAVKRARSATEAYAPAFDLAGYVTALARRTTILREWLQFLVRFPLLLMPVSWQLPFSVDYDQHGIDTVRQLLDAQHPMLAISVLGLPGLAVPMPAVENVPIGVQLVANRFREDICFAAGEVLEARSPISISDVVYSEDHARA